MRLIDRYRQALGVFAIALILFASLPMAAANAGLVSTDAVIAETFAGPADTAAAERAKIDAFLDRDAVQAQLAALGVDPAEAKARVAALSDEEIAAIAGELEQLPAGEGFFTTAAIIAGVALLVLLITDIAGITNVFTFVR